MTKEQLPPPTNLVEALQTHLQFEKEGEWLVKDDLHSIGEVGLYEVLPTRFRISTAGDRYEIGLRREDIVGLQELVKTIGKDPYPLDTLHTFWTQPSNGRFTVQEDSEWVYMGMAIEPTIDSFQKEFFPLLFAYSIALRAVLERRTYDDMAQDKWHGGFVRYALNSGEQRTVLFGQMDHIFEIADNTRFAPVTESRIGAAHLSELSLRDDYHPLKFAPGKVMFREETLERQDILVSAYNGRNEIEIISSQSTYDRENDKWIRDSVRVTLPIPPDASVETFADMVQLEIAEIKVEREGTTVDSLVGVTVEVEGDIVRITAEDEWFQMEVQTPVCHECGIPNWLFPEGISEEARELSGFGHFGHHTSLGIHRFTTRFDGTEKTYCADCIAGVVQQHLDEIEYANEAYALQRVEAELQDMGYGDVDIHEGERGMIPNGWLFETSVDYFRGERMITRFTGHVTLDESGNFASALQPREFVLFVHSPSHTGSE